MRPSWIVATAIAGLFVAGRADAAPRADLQNLKWFVVSGIGQGQDLAHFQGVIDQAMADAKLQLEGDQGPSDVPCCVDLRRVAISQINQPTLRSVDSAADYDNMTSICGSGSCAFLVDHITYCGGDAPAAIGCADTPLCSENLPGDDPLLTLVVSLDALADGALAQTIAHERGHNSCLEHVPWAESPIDSPCALMQPAAGGGCLNAAECGHYRDAGNGVGGACGCHTDALATVADGTACSDGALNGVCSGGVCGERGSDASQPLLAAGGPQSLLGDRSDERLQLSGLSGGWTSLGVASGGVEITGLEYAPGRRATYAVTADDQLLRLDPVSGLTMATIGTLPATGDFCSGSCYPTGASSNATYDSLAYDPGLSAATSDDLLYAVRVSESCGVIDPDCSGGAGFCAGELVSIDPDTAATTVLGPLDQLFCGGFTGLAFDATRRKLYLSGAAGVSLFEVDTSCTPSFCAATEVLYGANDSDPAQLAARQVLSRSRTSLAYSSATDRLYRIGTDGTREIYDVFDAATLLYAEPIGIDGFTDGGLAAPEPAAGASLAAALATLAIVARRRS